MAEAAGSDDHRVRARGQLGLDSLDDAVGGESGVGQRRDIGGIEVADGHQPTRVGNEQVLGHRAIDAEPDPGRPLHAVDAEVLGAGCTRLTLPAAEQAVHRHGCAVLQAFDTAAEPVDPARGLVPEHERRTPGRHPLGEFAHHVQVGVARAGAADLDHNLSGTRLGLGQVHQFGIGLEALELQGAHESLRCGQASSVSGLVSRAATERRYSAAGAPSTARWSKVMLRVRTWVRCGVAPSQRTEFGAGRRPGSQPGPG